MSLNFLMQCAPTCLDSWRLSVWNLFSPLLTKSGSDLIVALLSTVYTCSLANPGSMHSGHLILYDLINCLKYANNGNLTLKFINLLVDGGTEMSVLNSLINSSTSTQAVTFTWQCLEALGEVHQPIQEAVVEKLVDAYILLRCSQSKNNTWVGSPLSELSDQIYEVFTTSTELTKSASLTGLLIRLFSQRASNLPRS